MNKKESYMYYAANFKVSVTGLLTVVGYITCSSVTVGRCGPPLTNTPLKLYKNK